MSGFPNVTDTELEARAKELLAGKIPKAAPANVNAFEIAETDIQYIIKNVVCQDEVYTLGLLKNILEKGKKSSFWALNILGAKEDLERKNARDWREYSIKKYDSWRVVSAPLQFGLFNALYQNKDGKYADLIFRVLNQTLRPVLLGVASLPMSTLTGSVATSSHVYHGQNLDEIVHDYGLPSANRKNTPSFLGPSTNIVQADNALVEAITGFDTKTVDAIMHWISQNPGILFKNDYEGDRALMFGANYIHTCVSEDNVCPAFGIRIISQTPIGGSQ